jgi:hypothetical protein
LRKEKDRVTQNNIEKRRKQKKTQCMKHGSTMMKKGVLSDHYIYLIRTKIV